MTNDGFQNEIVTVKLVSKNDTVQGDRKLLDLIDELTDKVVINTQNEEENLMYSSYITCKFFFTENISKCNLKGVGSLVVNCKKIPTDS